MYSFFLYFQFQTKIGDIIDCIDIYKQPAFDNPLLKNHKIQVRYTNGFFYLFVMRIKPFTSRKDKTKKQPCLLLKNNCYVMVGMVIWDRFVV